MMANLAERWLEQGEVWLYAHGVSVSGAILIAVLGLLAAAWSGTRARRAIGRIHGLDPQWASWAGSAIRRIVGVVAGLMALAQVGVASEIALIGLACMVALGAFVAHRPLSHLMAGVLLASQRSMRIGETIEACGVRGTIAEVGLFATSVRTGDGVFASIPNGRLCDSTIRNLTRLPTRQIEVRAIIGQSEDIDEVLFCLRDVMEQNGRLLREPPPEIVVSALRERTVVLTLRAWTLSAAYADVRCQLNRDTKRALDKLLLQNAGPVDPVAGPRSEPLTRLRHAMSSRV
jgi:small conductance mechanosensitive channel